MLARCRHLNDYYYYSYIELCMNFDGDSVYKALLPTSSKSYYYYYYYYYDLYYTQDRVL
jgi:hypothetical protein